MKSKEALEILEAYCTDYDSLNLNYEDEPPLDCEDELNAIKKDLKVLEIFKKYLYIRVSEKPSFDDSYFVALQEDEEQECDYTCIFVNKEEKELLEEWLKNDK